MRTSLALLLLALAATASAADTPEELLRLEVFLPAASGQAADAAPPRLVILADGGVFVGGSSHVAAGRLERGQVKELEKRLERIRKMTRLDAPVSFGPGVRRYRLSARKAKLDVQASGDPAGAAPALKAFAAFVAELEAFDHPSLRPWRPVQYALRAREGSLPGGCRSWEFDVPLQRAVGAPQAVPASAAADWPTGVTPASVCADDRRYVVTLRPLLPGERP